MNIENKIKKSSNIAVFARNHRKYLKSAVHRNTEKPEQFITFRASKLWKNAHIALQIHKSLTVYFVPIGGEKIVEYEAIIHNIKLKPVIDDVETNTLLGFSLTDEALWEKSDQKKVNTLYVITHCKKVSHPFPMTELIKVSDEQPISKNYGYSYSLVYKHHSIPPSDLFISHEEVEYSEPYYEGVTRKISVNSYERSAKARKKCVAHYGLSCSVCGFNFEKAYGEIGKGFIHVHHIKSLVEVDSRYRVDPINDLRTVCPNCHAMLHTASPPLSIEELKEKRKS